MTFLKIHKVVCWLSAALFGLALVIGGIIELPNRTAIAMDGMWLSGSCFMVSYCLKGIEVGRIELLSSTDELTREKEPFQFWLFTMICLGTSVLLVFTALFRLLTRLV